MKNFLFFLAFVYVCHHIGFPQLSHASSTDPKVPDLSSSSGIVVKKKEPPLQNTSSKDEGSSTKTPQAKVFKEIIPAVFTDKKPYYSGSFGYIFPNLGETEVKVEQEIERLLQKKGEILRVLEIGCGAGRLAFKVVNKYPGKIIYCANDLVPKNLDALKIWNDSLHKTDLRKENIHCIPGDGTELRKNSLLQKHFPKGLDGQFDIIVCAHVLHFLTPAKALSLLSDMYRYLKKEGKAYVISSKSIPVIGKKESQNLQKNVIEPMLVFQELEESSSSPDEKEKILQPYRNLAPKYISLDLFENLDLLRMQRYWILSNFAKEKKLFFPGFCDQKLVH